MARFNRYIGIDYSGAETPGSRGCCSPLRRISTSITCHCGL